MIYPHHLPYPGSRRRVRTAPVKDVDEAKSVARPRRRFRWKTALAWTLVGLFSVASVLVLAFTLVVVKLRGTLPTAMQIATYQPTVGTNIYSSDGVLLATLQLENRRVISLKDVSPDLIHATLAVEDDRFFQHGAVDPKGLVRAAYANFTSGNSVGQGGSTITMQLARNVESFGLTREKRFTRKLREIMTAERIEQVFDKNEVLELYLNQIYYGCGAYGVEAASRTFFGKPAKKLTLSEAAMIAGLPRRPDYYSPFAHRDRAQSRRDVVLARMLTTGRIIQKQYDEAVAEPLKVQRPQPSSRVYRAPYFVDWVVQDLVHKYGVDTVYGGMNIVTTLDWRMQQAAEQSLRRGLSHGATQGALVCIDPHNGEVRAMVGGLDYKKDRYNAITQGRRQPGSAFKPILYAAAFDTGTVSLEDEVTDDPTTAKSGRTMWTVHNYGGNYSHQQMTVMHAITQSVNTVAVKVAADTGVDRVVQYAKAMGISTPLAPYLSLALGSSAVRPIDLCSAYEHFAGEGPRYDPTGIRSLKDTQGREIEVPGAESRRHNSPLSASTIVEMNQALRSVVTEGTGYAANVVPHAFGKTGTTSDLRDAWFVGYTPELVTAVWVASPHRDKHGVLRYGTMDGGTGGHVAAPIWAKFMSTAVPIQRRSNSLRHEGPYAIALPPPPPPPVKPEPTEEELAAKQEAQARQEAAQWLAEARRSNPDLGADGQTVVERHGSVVVFHPSAQSQGWNSRRSLRDGAESSEHGLTMADRKGMVRVCADSGMLATANCPTTYLMDPNEGEVPHRRCQMHHSPDGE